MIVFSAPFYGVLLPLICLINIFPVLDARNKISVYLKTMSDLQEIQKANCFDPYTFPVGESKKKQEGGQNDVMIEDASTRDNLFLQQNIEMI